MESRRWALSGAGRGGGLVLRRIPGCPTCAPRERIGSLRADRLSHGVRPLSRVGPGIRTYPRRLAMDAHQRAAGSQGPRRRRGRGGPGPDAWRQARLMHPDRTPAARQARMPRHRGPPPRIPADSLSPGRLGPSGPGRRAMTGSGAPEPHTPRHAVSTDLVEASATGRSRAHDSEASAQVAG
jgi:hypothetical protein